MKTNSESEAPLLLALETSGDLCSIALLRGERLISEHRFAHHMRLSERLLEFTDRLLLDAEATIERVDIFATGVGPGSFTGTRIGVMTAKMLASLFKKPLYGIDSLSALAQGYAGFSAGSVFPILPCRANVVYSAAFDSSGTVPIRMAPTEAITLDEVVERAASLSPQCALFCGEAVAKYHNTLTQALEKRGVHGVFLPNRHPTAWAAGSLALQRYLAGDRGEEPRLLAPEYVAPPPITLPKQGFATRAPQISRQGD